MNLEFLPSPDPAQPGMLLRDPYAYSPATLLIPPALIPGLQLFNGARTLLDLEGKLASVTGLSQCSEIAADIFQTLNEAGFLENNTYQRMKSGRELDFAQRKKRDPVFAGSAYPGDKKELAALLALQVGDPQGTSQVRAIAAPHASPDGGWATYRAAYEALPSPAESDGCTFVILGTSHYGTPERFGLTRKPFVTPLGEARTNLALVDEIERAAPKAVVMEDYCHSLEHSIELQIVFLQHLYGPAVQILPILCGSFANSLYKGGLPEDDEHVRCLFDTLGDLSAREGNKLLWVLGVDMAHVGKRYGDRRAATANFGEMLEVEQRDFQRIGQIAAGDSYAYWKLIQENHDDLKWCGSAPIYTFLKTMPEARGQLLSYHQWQIDEESVVSFSALEFR